MKRLLLIFVTTVIVSCSFDNKTGIWKDASKISKKNQSSKTISDNNLNTRYEDVFLKKKLSMKKRNLLIFLRLKLTLL